MADHREDDRNNQSDNNEEPQQRNTPTFRGPMMQGGFDPSLMKMGMMNPLQYQQLQQMMFMQQMQRQHMQRQPAAMSGSASNIPSESQKPPATYVCFKCSQPGHWIYYCPNVPKGQFVQRAHRNQMDTMNYSAKTQEFTCIICNKFMTEPVVIPCCGKSYCKECISSTLEKTNHCSFCNQEDTTVDQLIPNKTLKLAIEAHIEEQSKKRKEPMETGTEENNNEKPIKETDEEEEERKKTIVNHRVFNNNNFNIPPPPAGDMNWMNMGRPPFMNNRFPGFVPDMSWMGNSNSNNNNNNNNNNNGKQLDEMPLMNPGFPMVPHPPTEFLGYMNTNMHFNNTSRGGFSPRNRGRGRGSHYHNSQRRRSDYSTNEGEDEEPKRRRSRSRSPKRRDESSSRYRSRSSYYHSSHKRRSDYSNNEGDDGEHKRKRSRSRSPKRRDGSSSSRYRSSESRYY